MKIYETTVFMETGIDVQGDTDEEILENYKQKLIELSSSDNFLKLIKSGKIELLFSKEFTKEYKES